MCLPVCVYCCEQSDFPHNGMNKGISYLITTQVSILPPGVTATEHLPSFKYGELFSLKD